MYHQKYIFNKDVTKEELNEIIKIKSVAWPYSYQEQFDWIRSNIKDSDIHVLLYSDEIAVAYLNLIDLYFFIDRIEKHGYGIGNVCAILKSKGFGKEIIMKTNSHLKQNNKIGLLFCRKSLVDFYKSYNWTLIEKEKISLSFDNELIETMIFNLDADFQLLEFFDKPF